MSDLLKVKVGGSDYLCKWKPNFVVIGGRAYKTVKIGNQEWLAENLDYKFEGCVIGASGTSSSEPRGNYYNNDEATYGVNGNKYGLLYNIYAATYLEQNKSTLLPQGWSVPSKADYDTLVSYVGGSSVAGVKLKSTTSWTRAGTDDYEFSMYSCGIYIGSFSQLGSEAYLLTKTPYDSNYYLLMFANNDETSIQFSGLTFQASIRLVKD